MRGYTHYRKLFADRELPLAFVDRDAVDRNIESVQARADGTPVRIASKSIRCRAVMEYVLDHEGFRGVMCYHGHEAAYLAEDGFEDLLVAYPIWQESELRAVCDAIADGATVTLMVDSPDHVAQAARVASEAGVEVPLCLDVDMSTEHLAQYFGVRRSGVRTPAEARPVAQAVDEYEGVRLTSVMGYEAQIAGLPDRSPGNNAAVNAIIRKLKERSKAEIEGRRGEVVRALEAWGHDVAFVNGGGTGSVEYTVRDPAVTEVTVGSGFYAPRQFDHYDHFEPEPAAGFAVEIARRPSDGVYTCRGGGYVASGPPGADKIPAVHLPTDASLTDTEAAGEVQTPVVYDGRFDLELGDPVVLRHGKAGELCRNFTELAIVSDGEIAEMAPTYRGDGRCFM